jgi:hypothetical protein
MTYVVAIMFWVLYFFFELGSWYLDYDKVWVADIRRAPIAMGRMATLWLFLAK